MSGIKELILYRDFEEQELFDGFGTLTGQYRENGWSEEEKAALYYKCAGRLVEMAASHGFTGNLWHNFLTYLLVSHENAYSRACEIRGETGGTLKQIALHDLAVFRELFQFDLHNLETVSGIMGTNLLTEYQGTDDSGRMYNRRIRDKICMLCTKLGGAENAEAFQKEVSDFYRDFGVGKFGLHKAFRIQHKEEGMEIVPITNILHVKLDDLVGYETAKAKLTANTEAFLCGRGANNCLLYGDAGTGKSSSMKALANQYYDRGLRIIELYKHQFQDLNDVIAAIKNRNYRFIIYMDDLSFEDFEIEYKYLKAVIEGGLEKKPDNILIYATSNRRHLVREKFSDKADLADDLHNNDTVQEKLSLAARFGVQIYFGAPDKKEYHKIVEKLAEKHHIRMEREMLLAEADQWELGHGGRSGRTAQQFINHLLGKEAVL